MKNRAWYKAVVLFLFLPQFAACSTSSQKAQILGESQVLGGPPMCEASAATWMTCEESDEGCLIIGDNERSRDLYRIPLRNGDPENSRMEKVELNLELSKKGKPKKIKDIEAISAYDKSELLVFGSHSRNSKCEKDDDSRKFARVDLSLEEGQVNDRKKTSKISCKTLFGKEPPDNGLKEAVCTSVTNVEEEADSVEDGFNLNKNEKEAKRLCKTLAPYNAEGLLFIPDETNPQLWIGLRSPILGKHPDNAAGENLAILLHMPDSEEYQFDSVALLDLEGRGVRELAHQEDTIWVIAGPPEDRDESEVREGDFQLRSFKESSLNMPGPINTLHHADVPPSSEGLAITGSRAYVVIDGER